MKENAKKIFTAHKRVFSDIGFIFYRNVVSLANGIIFVVVMLLFGFGDIQAGLFLGITIVANIFFGLVQDLRARIALERLALLAAPQVRRVGINGEEEIVPVENIKSGDIISLRLGDQAPCDGVLSSARGFEVSEALITGESKSFPRGIGEKVLAGGIVTSGSALMRASATFAESRISKMTENIKKYSINLSPIQRSIDTVILYTGYALVFIIAFVVIRGVTLNEVYVRIIKTVAALASTLVPQGLIVATTVLFAFGAASLFRRRVLLQDINATEKLGRIKNLCFDKTGTLTENELRVEDVYVQGGLSREYVDRMVAGYVAGSGDSSQTILAIVSFISVNFTGDAVSVIPFSSVRKYGAVRLKDDGQDAIVLLGAPDAFLSHIADQNEKAWFSSLIDTYSREGKRLMGVAVAKGSGVSEDLSGSELSAIAIFVLHNDLREGVRETVQFFKERGVSLRVISGDNRQTVQAVASSAGIENTDAIITGDEMEKWSDSDFSRNAKNYAIFARIKPEQKEKIIKALKEDGFTAMIGDGANDALAVKAADLGISMWNGAAATRQIASVVLTDDSFSALPGGVRQSDNIIKNVEILAAIFLNQVAIGFFLFAILAFFGQTYPFTPQNITLINYFTVGFPGMLIFYWAMNAGKKTHQPGKKSFLKRVLPYPFWIGLVEAVGAAAVFFLSPEAVKSADSNTLVLFSFIVFGFVFFALAPRAYGGKIRRGQKMLIAAFGAIELLLLYSVFQIPSLVAFFDLSLPSLKNDMNALSVILVFSYIQYRVTRSFFFKKEELSAAANS